MSKLIEGNGWGADADYYHNGMPMVATQPPHSNPISDAMEYLDGKVKGFQPPIDPEDVRRLTQGMKRENWKAPGMCSSIEDLAVAYLEEWKTAMFGEFQRIGIGDQSIRGLVRRGC